MRESGKVTQCCSFYCTYLWLRISVQPILIPQLLTLISKQVFFRRPLCKQTMRKYPPAIMDYLHVAKTIIFSFKLVFSHTLNIILQLLFHKNVRKGSVLVNKSP